MLGMTVFACVEPAAVRELLRSGDRVVFSVPFKTFDRLLDDWDHMVDGQLHDVWRKAMSVSLSPAAVEGFVPRLSSLIQSRIADWAAAPQAVPLLDQAGDLALDFALEVLVGVPLLQTDRTWLKQQLLTYFAGLYVLALPIPGSAYSKAQTAKAAIIEAFSRELEGHVSALLAADPAAGTAVDAAAVLRRLDGAAKAVKLQQDPALQMSPGAVAACMQRLKQQEASLSAAVAAPAPAGDGRQQRSAAGAVQQQQQQQQQPDTAASAPAASMADVQLEVLRAQRRLSTATAATRIMGTFIGAVDTTRYMLFSVLACLCQLPAEVEALRQEQEQVISQHGPCLTAAAMADMTRLEACLKEAMRLLPAARVGMRQATKDMVLAGVAIPAGSYLIFSIDAAHALDPTLWNGLPPGAAVPPYMDWRSNLHEAFQPSRWLLQDPAKRPKSFFTFGLGAHSCLGMGLVFTEVKLLLALLLRGGYSWRFQDPDVLAKMAVFPGFKPAAGTDGLIISKAPQP